jgi:hypothetical protein
MVAQNSARSVAKVFDARIANRLSDRLADELILADVMEAPPLGFEVWVRMEDFVRAKEILENGAVTDAELSFLATGALGKASDSG